MEYHLESFNVINFKRREENDVAAEDETDWSELARELMASGRALQTARGHERRPKDIEMRGEMNALHMLHHNPAGMTPTALARACQVSTARITKTIDQLEGRGLVARQPSPKDRRSVTVRLTDEGETEVERRFEKVNEYIAKVLRELGEEDARELVRLIGRLAQVMPARQHDAGCPMGEGGADEAR